MNIVKYSKKFNIIKNNLISSSRYSLKEYQNIQSKIKLSKTNNIKKFLPHILKNMIFNLTTVFRI